MERGRYVEASEAFHETVRLKPDFADGHHMLGAIYHDKIPDQEKAAFHLKKADLLYVKLEEYSRSAQVRLLIEQIS